MSVIKKEKPEIIQPKKMGLLVENPVYKPFRYPWCYDAWLTQQRIHCFFFFKQKTAYEISACLVGSEMCIRDSGRKD